MDRRKTKRNAKTWIDRKTEHTLGLFIVRRWIQYPPTLTTEGGVICVYNVFNTHNTHRNTQPRNGGVICVYNVYGLRPRYLQSSRLVKPPYNLNPALYFGHYSRLIQNNAPILYTSAQKYMYRWRMIGLGWQIGIGTSCRSLIRGKGWEGKTNNQLESPLRFNGTYTQVPQIYTGCTGI